MGQTERRPPHDPVQLVLVALANPKKSAVLVTGPAGSGKSRVLSEVQSHVDTGDPGRRRLVVVDDVDLLDPASLALLAENLDRQAIRLVAAARAPGRVLRVLRPLRPPALVPLRPWRREEVAEYAAGQVGGPLHELTLTRLLRFSGGNPLCVTELVDEGVASGRLHRAYDCWTWDGPMVVPPLTEARVAGRLDELPPPVRDVHATVALAGTVQLPVLEAVFPADVVEAADEAGVLRVDPVGGMVRAAVPVEAAVAVQTLAPTRRRRLTVAYAAALPVPPVAVPDPAAGTPGGAGAAPAEPEPDGMAVRRVLALAGAGTLAAAVTAATGALPRLTGEEQARVRALLGACELAQGRVGAAAAQAETLRRTGLTEDRPYAYALGALLAGRCALAAGRARAAAHHLSESVVEGIPALRAYGLVLLALAYARAGDSAAADRVLYDADRADPAPGLAGELAELTRAEILLARGRPSGAVRVATAVAERCQPAGPALAALEALHLLARLDPSPDTAARLAAAGTGDPLGRLQAEHARALAAGDGEALSTVAAGYDATGLHWLAGETAAASLALAPADRRAGWVTADRRILERTDAQADVELPAQWRGGDRFEPLTQREREITELAAGGLSSPRIAAQLHLSRRTIENHLQHSYRKLGVSRREELAAALGRSAAAG